MAERPVVIPVRLTVKQIREKKGVEKIAVLTAYDHLFGGLVDHAGLDIVLVGDSLGMVLLGYESTVPVTMRDMLHHTKAASRGVKRAMVVADMPFGSYDTPERALRNAKRFMKEAGADAVKLEGGSAVRKQVEALVQAGIPVMGHLGLTPQSASQLGGYRVQGKTVAQAEEIFKDAVLLDKLGVFSVVLECIPQKLAARITKTICCPTIGIGAGAATDGQVLVITDMLGLRSQVQPKFARVYADLGKAAAKALAQYRNDVVKGKFPTADESY